MLSSTFPRQLATMPSTSLNSVNKKEAKPPPREQTFSQVYTLSLSLKLSQSYKLIRFSGLKIVFPQIIHVIQSIQAITDINTQ
jgi:hypothetical protein